MELILYTKKDCPLCEEAKGLLEVLQSDYTFHIEERDIYKNDQLLEKYQLMIPVVEIDGEEIDYGKINLSLISKRLQEKNP